MANEIGDIKVSPEQVAEICLEVMPTGTPVIVQGAPGCAKTYTGMQLPKLFEKRTGEKYSLRVLNLAQHEPTDIGGIPYVRDGKMHMAISDLWPTEPNNVIVVEEFTKGPRLSQNALGEVILEHTIGGKYKLPENTYFFLSCNRRNDGAGDEKILSHLANRACILNMGVDPDGFLSHAIRQGFHVHLVAFLNQFKHLVFDEKGFKGDGKYNPEKPSFASPRTWEKVSRALYTNLSNSVLIPVVAGLVGEGPMREFIAWREIMNEMPDVDLCISSPSKAPVPKQMAVIYSLTVSLAYSTTEKNVGNVVKYIERLPKEYQILWATSVSQRDTKFITSCKEIREWIGGVADIIWG